MQRWGRVRNLLKLGTRPGVAIPMCLSRKGPWRCACTMATQTGITNQWLKDQGLLSVKELWVKIHYPVGSGNRLMRTRMIVEDPVAGSGVEAGGEPPCSITSLSHSGL